MGLTEKANNYYKMFITWTNEKIRKTFVERNMFDFKHIKGFDRSYIQQPGPMVVLSTPGKSFFSHMIIQSPENSLGQQTPRSKISFCNRLTHCEWQFLKDGIFKFRRYNSSGSS